MSEITFWARACLPKTARRAEPGPPAAWVQPLPPRSSPPPPAGSIFADCLVHTNTYDRKTGGVFCSLGGVGGKVVVMVVVVVVWGVCVICGPLG